MELKVGVLIERAGEEVQAELSSKGNGVVSVFVPSVGTNRIARFEVNTDELIHALRTIS